MTTLETPVGMGTYKTYDWNVRAVQWPREWEKQAQIAKYLGMSGIRFQFDDGDKEPSPNHYLPQLYLFSHRWDRLNVRIGDWIVLGDLPGRFAVLPTDEFSMQYQKTVQ